MALILASGSPRRRELMSLITPDYTVITSDVDETKIAADSPAHLAKALATAALELEMAIKAGADTGPAMNHFDSAVTDTLVTMSAFMSQ